MVADYNVALAIAIGALIGATVFRTFIPITTKIMAEIQLASAENRDPVLPKMHWIWLVGAGINIILVGFPLFATIDQFVVPIMEVTSPVIAFFIVWGLAMSALEVIFRIQDAGINKTDTVQPKEPEPAPTG